MSHHHPRRHRWLPIVTVTLALAAAGCAGEGASVETAGSSAPVSPPAPTSATPSKVDLAQIFPEGDGRELVLNNCQNCHTFVPIVVLQMEPNAWKRSSLDHRERVTRLTDQEFERVYAYLVKNFGPHRPVPDLPPELLKSWTTY